MFRKLVGQKSLKTAAQNISPPSVGLINPYIFAIFFSKPVSVAQHRGSLVILVEAAE